MKKLLLLASCSLLLAGCFNSSVDKGVLKDNQSITIYIDSVVARSYSKSTGHQSYVKYEVSTKEAKVWYTDYYSKKDGYDYFKGSISLLAGKALSSSSNAVALLYVS